MDVSSTNEDQEQKEEQQQVHQRPSSDGGAGPSSGNEPPAKVRRVEGSSSRFGEGSSGQPSRIEPAIRITSMCLRNAIRVLNQELVGENAVCFIQ